MLSRLPIWGFSLIVAMLLFSGCTSGQNETTPAPASTTPTKGAQQASRTALTPQTMGHTEPHGGGSPITGEKEHCFKKDDTRDLILTFTSTDDLTNSTVSAFLINSNDITAPFVVEDIPTISKSGKTATIVFSDAVVPGAQRTSIIQHLGPGPYMEVTIVDPTGGTGTASAAPKLRTGDVYSYITVDDPKTQCH